MDTPSTPPPPPPPPPAPPPPPPPAPAPKKGGNRTLIIVLCVVLGIFVLIGGCVVGAVIWGAKKAKQYSEEAERNPSYAALNTALSLASLGGEIEVLNRDPAKGIITVKNKKTGETIRIDSSDYTPENIGAAMEKISRSAGESSRSHGTARNEEADEQTSASQETVQNEPEPAAPPPERKVSAARANAMATVLKKFPSHIPSYPGGNTQNATLTSLGGATIGNYEFTTSDEPEKVVEYYEKKITSAGYSIQVRGNDANDHGPTAAIAGTKDDEMVSVNAESTENGVKATITFTKKGD